MDDDAGTPELDVASSVQSSSSGGVAGVEDAELAGGSSSVQSSKSAVVPDEDTGFDEVPEGLPDEVPEVVEVCEVVVEFFEIPDEDVAFAVPDPPLDGPLES